MKPNPQQSERFERIAIKKLQEMGRTTEQMPTYYSKLTKDMQDTLIKINSPTALYIRTLPDLISICFTSKIIVFLFEVKSYGMKYNNLSVEAFPFGISKKLSEIGINTLYLIVNTNNEEDIRGEFVENINAPKRIERPLWRWGTNELEKIDKNLLSLFPYLGKGDIFPNSHIKDARKTCFNDASGDPYFLIHRDEIDSWKRVEDIELLQQKKLF